jgi:cytochrome P450
MEPVLADITSHDTFVEGVPHETFKWLRENDQVHWTEECDGGRGFWSVTRYDDVLTVSRNSEIYSSRLGIRLEDMDDEETEARRTLMEMDAPEHTRLRRLVSRPFSPKSVAEYEGAVREIAVEILEKLRGQTEFDFVQAISRELPMRMLGRLLGLPSEDLDWLVQRGDALIGNSDPEFTEFVVDKVDTSAYAKLPFRSPVSLELFEYAAQALEERRITPTMDILSKLLEPTVDGDSLDDLALKNFFVLMVAAGNDTTRYSITHALTEMSERPELWAAIPTMETPELKSLVDEMLRCSSVTMHFRRTVMQDTELGGKQLKKGDKVVMWFISANYDENHWGNPFDFDARRAPNQHVSFGLQSPHLCLGAHLARLEMRVIFEEMAKRWSKVEIVGKTERFRSNFISGIKYLPIKVTWSS